MPITTLGEAEAINQFAHYLFGTTTAHLLALDLQRADEPE